MIICYQDITKVKNATIAHGVNCKRVMGAGVAKAISNRWPEVREEFLKITDPRLGMIQSVPVSGKLSNEEVKELIKRGETFERDVNVINCFTQYSYGRDPGKQYASISAIVSAFTQIRENFPDVETIYIPKIGCGFGGLKWEDVRESLLRIEEMYYDAFEYRVCVV